MLYPNSNLMEATKQLEVSPDSRPIRVLHVVGSMNRGGVETWLMHVLRQLNRDHIQMDFLVHTSDVGAYDNEIMSLGSRVIPCPDVSHPWKYKGQFQKILQQYGPYDIVHSHVHHFSGYVLRLAQQVGVPVRIAHSHNNTSAANVRAGFLRQLYLALMLRWINRYATLGFAASSKAADDLFRTNWKQDSRWQTLYCGIDLKSFVCTVDRATLRAELGIPQDAFVVGHVGRFDPQKNHKFLIEIAAAVAAREPNFWLLLIGKGDLCSEVEQELLQRGLRDRTTIAGVRPDVPCLMKAAMDTFVLPSLHEGLPLVLLEAQAAGLPCIISDVVTEEADIIQPLISRLSLSNSAAVWADKILSAQNRSLLISPEECQAIVSNSHFNSTYSTEALVQIYANEV